MMEQPPNKENEVNTMKGFIRKDRIVSANTGTNAAIPKSELKN